MATLTIRNLPDEVHARLKAQARRNRRSLNQEVIAELIGIEDVNLADDGARKRRRAEEMIGKVAEMRRGMKGFMAAKAIDAAIEEGRR